MLVWSHIRVLHRFDSIRLWTWVTFQVVLRVLRSWLLSQRSEHNIEDELVFANHKGYIFHDSRGFEAGSDQELRIVQQFIRQRATQIKLKDRLHAIWFAFSRVHDYGCWWSYVKVLRPDGQPTTRARFETPWGHLPWQEWCVFVKHWSVRVRVTNASISSSRHCGLHQVWSIPTKCQDTLEDFGKINDDVSGVAGRQFKEHYLHRLGGVRFVRLESTFCIKFGSRVLMLLKEMHKPEMRSGCHALLKETVEVLNGDAVTLMLLAAQRSNLELSVSVAVKRWVSRGIEKGYTLTRHWSASRIGLNNDITRDLIKTCLFAFPQIWASPLFYFGSSFLNPFLILLLQFVSACITLI